MAVGDVCKGLQSVATGSYLDIQPSGTVEWVIHNIYHEAEVELYLYDGSNNLLFDSDDQVGVFARYAYHCTNGQRVRVKNTNASSKLIGYDGIVTHT